jgi:two-component system, LytTR family, response regulator
MSKCIILDDEENCRVALRELIRQHVPGLEIIYHSDDANHVYDLVMDGTLKPDIVFLDIQMPKCDGFSFLKKFDDLPFFVVFTTAYDQYAIKAIRFSALDYLLKPIDTNDLLAAVAKLKQGMTGSSIHPVNTFRKKLTEDNLFHKLAIPSISEINFVETQQIIYFESSNNYTTVYTDSGEKLISSKNIGYYEELLEGLYFFRVHNSYIINLKKIKKYMRGKTGLIEMDNGQQIAVSVRRKDEFIKMMNLM